MRESELVPVSEAARQLGITRQRVHALINAGQLRATRLGRYYYIDKHELQRYAALPVGKPRSPRSTAGGGSIDECK